MELEDAAAVKKAIKDLAFLSSESKAYRSAHGGAGGDPHRAAARALTAAYRVRRR